jgi:hypothetical protein
MFAYEVWQKKTFLWGKKKTICFVKNYFRTPKIILQNKNATKNIIFSIKICLRI